MYWEIKRWKTKRGTEQPDTRHATPDTLFATLDVPIDSGLHFVDMV